MAGPKYTAQQKASFFDLIDKGGTLRAVAKVVGVHDPTRGGPGSSTRCCPSPSGAAEIESREVPGHWEGDLIIGAAAGSAIATLVERTSRYVMLVHLGDGRSADAVRDSLINTVRHMPAALRGTLTWDQGAEMSEHRAFTIATNVQVYFCEAGSPWQRGTNENTNGLLRQYFPRGTDLSLHSVEQLQAIADELNARPRKALDWDSPTERIAALLTAS